MAQGRREDWAWWLDYQAKRLRASRRPFAQLDWAAMKAACKQSG